MMSVQELREKITASLQRHFPNVPIYVEGEKPQVPYFHPGLITATYDRQRENRYLAVYRFGIRYERASMLAAEQMADQMSEVLAAAERDNGSLRIVRQAWEAGNESKGPLFTVDYMLYLQQANPEAVKMEHMTGGERLK